MTFTFHAFYCTKYSFIKCYFLKTFARTINIPLISKLGNQIIFIVNVDAYEIFEIRTFDKNQFNHDSTIVFDKICFYSRILCKTILYTDRINFQR